MKNEKSYVLASTISGGAEAFFPCNRVVVTITQNDAKLLLRLIDIVKRLRVTESMYISCLQMFSAGISVVDLHHIDDYLVKEGEDDISDYVYITDWSVLPLDSFDEDNPVFEAQRIICEEANVCDDSVYWSAYQKYSDPDVRVETQRLDLEIIEKMANGEELVPDMTIKEWETFISELESHG